MPPFPVRMKRREFFERTVPGAAALAASAPAQIQAAQNPTVLRDERRPAHECRITFGAWINDLRTDPLAVDHWPAPQFDDASLESAIRAVDLQGPGGFNLLDVSGLFATYGWSPRIVSAVDSDRRRRIRRLIRAATARGLKAVLVWAPMAGATTGSSPPTPRSALGMQTGHFMRTRCATPIRGPSSMSGRSSASGRSTWSRATWVAVCARNARAGTGSSRTTCASTKRPRTTSSNVGAHSSERHHHPRHAQHGLFLPGRTDRLNALSGFPW